MKTSINLSNSYEKIIISYNYEIDTLSNNIDFLEDQILRNKKNDLLSESLLVLFNQVANSEEKRHFATLLAKNISGIKEVSQKKIFANFAKFTKECLETVSTLHVYVSPGNKKTGAIPSVSLRPVLDCGNCKFCGKKCYDLRNDCCYPTVQYTRSKNYAIWKKDPERYFEEISIACRFETAFRWHIGGDIVNRRYLEGVVKVANENKHCTFLIFTKMFDLINTYLDEGNTIPENLQILFSGWIDQPMNNKYNFPSSHPIFADGRTTAHDGAYLCTRNCTNCLLSDRGCWTLKPGQETVFPAH